MEGDAHSDDGFSGEKRRIRRLFAERTGGTLATRTIADAMDRDGENVRELLGSMADRGELRREPDGGNDERWRYLFDPYVGRANGGSYTITDSRSGLVTRACSRPRALHRLADRIEQFEAGNHVGAQILGISESTVSPAYLTDREEILEEFVRPDHTHLYVYVQDDGVTEVETTEQLSRERRILGFTVTGRFDREAFDEVMLVSAETAVERTPLADEDFPVGVFKIAAVHPEHQREGIGTALTTHGMAYLAETPPILALLWGRDDDSNVALAEKLDFEKLATFDGVSPLERLCPQCGFENECTCGSVLYGWGFRSE